jgi:hypothetical protein
MQPRHSNSTRNRNSTRKRNRNSTRKRNRNSTRKRTLRRNSRHLRSPTDSRPPAKPPAMSS